MNLENPSKALIALVGLICITVLLAVGRIPTEAGTGTLFGCTYDLQMWVQDLGLSA